MAFVRQESKKIFPLIFYARLSSLGWVPLARYLISHPLTIWASDRLPLEIISTMISSQTLRCSVPVSGWWSSNSVPSSIYSKAESCPNWATDRKGSHNSCGMLLDAGIISVPSWVNRGHSQPWSPCSRRQPWSKSKGILAINEMMDQEEER